MKDFCDSTSLHGYTYLSNGTSIAQKVFWVIIIITMTAIGLSLLVQNTGDFCNSRIVTTIDSSSAPLDVSVTLIQELQQSLDNQKKINLELKLIFCVLRFFRRWYFHLLPFAI